MSGSMLIFLIVSVIPLLPHSIHSLPMSALSKLRQFSLFVFFLHIRILMFQVVIEGVNTNKIKGIGCDATCSLVLIGKDGNSASVSPKGKRIL